MCGSLKGVIMFICAECNKSSSPGEKLNRLVVQTRKKEYHNEKTKVPEKKITYGFETVKEIGLCGYCANQEYNQRWSLL